MSVTEASPPSTIGTDDEACVVCGEVGYLPHPSGYWVCETHLNDPSVVTSLDYAAEIESDRLIRQEDTDEAVQYELDRLRVRAKARDLFNTENLPPATEPEMLTIPELIARPRPEVDWRVEHWQPADSRVLMAAQNKVGKTTVTGNLARSLVDGDPWLGIYKTNPVDSVAIIDFEMSERMLAEWLEAQHIQNAEKVTIIPMRGNASAFNILDEKTRDEWAKRLSGFDYLILDCLAPIFSALAIDGNNEAGRFLTPFDELLATAGIPDALIADHMGHQNERATGDHRKRGWPDVEWNIIRETDDMTSARYINAYGRDVEIEESLLNYEPETRHLTLTGGTRKDVKAREAIPDILELILDADEPLSGRAIQVDMAASKHSRDAVRQAIRLIEAENLTQHAKGLRNATLFGVSK